MGKHVDKSQPDPRLLVGLLVFALAASLLAVFQWMELIVVQQGGASVCGISKTLDCEAVWNSSFAKSIHAATRMPLAGWGLIWGLASFVVSLHLLYDVVGRRGYDTRIFAVRMVAAGGVVSVIGLVIVSMSIGRWCLTCLATYALVAAFTFCAFKLKPLRSLSDVSPTAAAGPVAMSLVLGYLALLVPGQRTPVEAAIGLGTPPPAAAAKAPAKAPSKPAGTNAQATAPKKPAADDSQLALYLAQLPPAALQAVSDSLHKLRTSKVVDGSKFPVRHRVGPANAPVHIIDFSDIRCGHCRRLNEVLGQLSTMAPPGSFSSEPRFFPLDSRCNNDVPPELQDPTNVRCVAPKILICLEDHPKYHAARDKIFEEQESISLDRVYEIATKATGRTKAALDKCAESPATKKKLAQDVAYATNFDVHGTPVVIVNGRQATSVAPFLYAMIIAGGNADDPAFNTLPAARPDAHVH